MNLLASETFSIGKPADEVFSFLSNMENFARWFPGVIRIESIDNDSHAVIGKTWLETVKVPLRGEKQITITVVATDGKSTFVTEGRFPPLLPRMEVRIVATDLANSQVHWQMFSRNNSAVFKLLILPIAKAVLSKRSKIGVRRLQRLLEKPSSPA